MLCTVILCITEALTSALFHYYTEVKAQQIKLVNLRSFCSFRKI